MTEEIKTEEPAESGVSAERFGEMFAEHMGTPLVEEATQEEEPGEVIEEKPGEVLDEKVEESQGEDADNPAPAEEKGLTYAEAIFWCKKGGLPDRIIESKSDDELLALGQEFSTLKRQDDREYSLRQNRESSESTQASAPEKLPGDVGASEEGDKGNPEDEVDEAEELAALELELGEEAARLVLESRKAARAADKRVDAIEARLQSETVERQAAAVKVQVDRALDGLGDEFPDLSKSDDVRQAVIDRAAQLAKADPNRYGEDPEKSVRAVLRDAAILEIGPPERRQPTRTSKPPATQASGSEDSEKGKGQVGRRAFDRLYRKHM